MLKVDQALEEKLTQPQQKKRKAAEMKTKSVAVARDSELAACGEKSKISNPIFPLPFAPQRLATQQSQKAAN
ncbi:hypothetical protein OUZ56_017595 [Daphnia magna]|uniref:Uncharacterized protein n=1 Tax=Daphnia magna TaxID=35525 RepID=A0ABR0ATD4_9CRUS|nr:hypothetical protein OUZ56_017595 [Daphnia magna]